MSDPFELSRFVQAQEGCWDAVREELRAGRKRTHWMWFVFPQLEGLGASAMATRYAIRSAEEAQAYLAHPLLGPRLEEGCLLLLAHEGRSARELLGTPDDVKLRSCMTLFASLPGASDAFQEVLEVFFRARPDEKTLALLRDRGRPPPEPGG